MKFRVGQEWVKHDSGSRFVIKDIDGDIICVDWPNSGGTGRYDITPQVAMEAGFRLTKKSVLREFFYGKD